MLYHKNINVYFTSLCINPILNTLKNLNITIVFHSVTRNSLDSEAILVSDSCSSLVN